MQKGLEDLIERVEKLEAATTGPSGDFNNESVLPAYGLEPAKFLSIEEFKKDAKKVREVDAETAILEGKSLVERGMRVSIDAAGLGHDPPHRGRRTGPDNRYWRDFCNTHEGMICFGPYHDLEPGVYDYYYDIRFQIPYCGGANDTVVFHMDSAHNIGHRIPGSTVYGFRWNFMCQHADENNVFEGLWGGSFAIAHPTRQVEMRLDCVVLRLAGLPFELLVRKLVYSKRAYKWLQNLIDIFATLS